MELAPYSCVVDVPDGKMLLVSKLPVAFINSKIFEICRIECFQSKIIDDEIRKFLDDEYQTAILMPVEWFFSMFYGTRTAPMFPKGCLVKYRGTDQKVGEGIYLGESPLGYQVLTFKGEHKPVEIAYACEVWRRF